MVSDARRLELNRDYFQAQILSHWQAYHGPRPRGWQKLWRARASAALATLEARLPQGAAVLDVGCGIGTVALGLAERGFRVTAVDLVEGMLAHGRRASADVAWVHAPFSDAISPKGSFDAVVALGYLEYQERAGKELVRMARLLKPGGLLLLSVPNTLSGRFAFGATRAVFRLGKEPEGMRIRHSFTPERLQRLLGMAGYIMMDYEWMGPEGPPLALDRDRARDFWNHRLRDRLKPEMLTLSRTYRPDDTAVTKEALL
jgi:2-polyprenyl-6-hydroxyphenyl methylase/3-demethylubiquinone-9 3-methyltransferase